jgi:D-glycero-D-manno-heptose 1,7-bisphosphate phosphatase
MRPAPEQCVILVGGLGTRLGSLTQDLPKPLVEVGGKPFLWYLLWHAKRHGFRRILLLAGHRAARVAELAPALGHEHGLTIEVVVEPQPLGTGGALRNALERLDERFILMNGDSLLDVNWLAMLGLGEQAADADVGMILRHQKDASRFGVVDLEGCKVTGFRERGSSAGGLINGGIYLIQRRMVEALPIRCSLERDVLPQLAANGQVAGIVQDGYFIDIGVPESLERAQTEVPASLPRPAVFFDRDGVLNRDHGYVHHFADFDWMDGAIDAVRLVNERGWFAFVVTNQAGVAHGYYDETAIAELHGAVSATLRAAGAHLDDIRYCPYHPEAKIDRYRLAHGWRKPAPGMLLDLAEHWPIDMGRSFIVGDRQTDIAAGQAAGIDGILYQTGRLDDLIRRKISAAEMPPMGAQA